MNREVLLKALGEAKEGSRELDAAIAVAVFKTISTDDDLVYAAECVRSDQCAPGTYWRKSRSGFSLRTAPEYSPATASCAMMDHREEHGLRARAEIEEEGK